MKNEQFWHILVLLLIDIYDDSTEFGFLHSVIPSFDQNLPTLGFRFLSGDAMGLM